MKLAVRDYKRDLEVVFLRNNKGWTFTKIGEKYGITKARVRQVYYRIIAERKKEEETTKKMGIGA